MAVVLPQRRQGKAERLCNREAFAIQPLRQTRDNGREVRKQRPRFTQIHTGEIRDHLGGMRDRVDVGERRREQVVVGDEARPQQLLTDLQRGPGTGIHADRSQIDTIAQRIDAQRSVGLKMGRGRGRSPTHRLDRLAARARVFRQPQRA